MKDQDGFTLVKYKKGKKKKLAGVNKVVEHKKEKEEEEEVTGNFLTNFKEAQKRFMAKLVVHPATSILLRSKTTFDFSEMVLYGVGRVSVSKPSQVQLALATLLADSRPGCHNRVFYDPAHTENDKLVLKHCGWTPVEVDEKGKRNLPQEGDKIMFFMPHCDRWLYANVLEHHAKNLKSICIFGNSFRNYVTINDSIQDEISAVCKNQLVTEIPYRIGSFNDDDNDNNNSNSSSSRGIHKQLLFESFNDSCLLYFTHV